MKMKIKKTINTLAIYYKKIKYKITNTQNNKYTNTQLSIRPIGWSFFSTIF